MSSDVARIVAIDIGGTHARFSIARLGKDGSIELDEPVTLRTVDHASFQLAWEAFRNASGSDVPDQISIAIAGPVGGDVIHFTNNPWVIRPALIPATLGVSRYTLVNDFAAVAHAVARAPQSEFVTLSGPDKPLPSQGTISVLGPGTGLGVAHLWRNGQGKGGNGGSYHVQATEGGHVDFAPLDSVDDAILARLRKRHHHVSVERVVSGPGIVDIYETLAAMEGRAVIQQDDVTLWKAGTTGQDSLAAAAVERFCLSLGAAAGDYALAHGAVGVVIAGGLGYRIRDTIKASGFADRFCAKGRFASMMSEIPVKLITHPQPGLFGAAAAFAVEHLA